MIGSGFYAEVSIFLFWLNTVFIMINWMNDGDMRIIPFSVIFLHSLLLSSPCLSIFPFPYLMFFISWVLECINILDMKVDMEKSKGKLRLVEVVLDDAVKKQVTKWAVETWLSNLKDVAYNAENLLIWIPTTESLKYNIYADDVKDMLI